VLRYSLDGLAVVAGILLLLLVLLTLRRRFVQRGASFDASLRVTPKRFGQGWVLGVARYADDRLEWFRAFSLSLRPHRVFPRDELILGARRDPEYPETLAVMPDHLIMAFTVGSEDLEFAMSAEAFTGFVAWRESSPPGRQLSPP